MKKNTIFLFIAFLFLVQTYSQGTEGRSVIILEPVDVKILQNIKENFETYKIKKLSITRTLNNRHVYKTEIKFDKRGNEIEKKYIDEVIIEPLIYSYEYNDKNDIIKESIEYKGTHTYESKSNETRYKFEYDNNDKIKKISYFFYHSDKVSAYMLYIYSGEKLLKTEYYTYGDKPENETFYNEKEKIIEYKRYNYRNLVEKRLYDYDDEGNLITYKEFRYKNKTPDTSLNIEYIYDNMNNMIEEKKTIDNKLSYLIRYEYNNKNELIKKNNYNKKEKFLSSEEYEYDENGFLKILRKYNARNKYYYREEYSIQKDEETNIIKVTKNFGDPKLKGQIQISDYKYEYWK